MMLFMSTGIHAQHNARTIEINSQGVVTLPADVVHFNIALNAGGESPQEAYKLHKQRENTLVSFLEEYKIHEDDISYQPISIQPNRNYNRPEEEPQYQTRQNISLTLRDFGVYEKIQVGLIEAGFDNFSGTFSSTRTDSAKDEAVKNAIRNAREKAMLIAGESGVTLGPVRTITYGDHSVIMQASERAEMSMADSGNLMQYRQTVTVSASVTMIFAIK